MNERIEKVERICFNIASGNFNGNPIGSFLVNEKLWLRFVAGGRDHKMDFQVKTIDGYISYVFTEEETNKIYMAIRENDKRNEQNSKNAVFDNIEI